MLTLEDVQDAAAWLEGRVAGTRFQIQVKT